MNESSREIILAQNPKVQAAPPAQQMPPQQLPQKMPPGAPAPGQPPPGQAPEPAPVDTVWSCKVQGLDDRGEPAGDLPPETTVGTKFHLSCEGPQISLAKESLSLEMPKEAKYALRILETRAIEPTRFEFVVTSWLAGEIKLPNPVLTDGKTRVGLGEVKFTIASSIDPAQNPEGKPYPPWSVQKLGWPVWIWGVALALLALIVLGFALRLRRTVRRKRLLKLLEKHPIAMTPYNHFNKELRRISRLVPLETAAWPEDQQKAFYKELDEQFRWYLARELVVPTFGRKSGEIMRDLKRSHPIWHSELRRDLSIALTELEKARASRKPSSKTRVSEQGDQTDAHQLLDLCRALAERARKLKESTAKGGAK